MTPQQFLQLLQQYSREIEHARQRTLPIKVGRLEKTTSRTTSGRVGSLTGACTHGSAHTDSSTRTGLVNSISRSCHHGRTSTVP